MRGLAKTIRIIQLDKNIVARVPFWRGCIADGRSLYLSHKENVAQYFWSFCLEFRYYSSFAIAFSRKCHHAPPVGCILVAGSIANQRWVSEMYILKRWENESVSTIYF